MDRIFRYRCSTSFLLFVITKTNWRNSATAILGIYDVNSTTPFFSRVHLIQNDALYRERKEERGKKKERALMKLEWRIKRYIWHRDNRNVFISRTLSKDNITNEWYDASNISLECCAYRHSHAISNNSYFVFHIVISQGLR
jgi:hypothetical protein